MRSGRKARAQPRRRASCWCSTRSRVRSIPAASPGPLASSGVRSAGRIVRRADVGEGNGPGLAGNGIDAAVDHFETVIVIDVIAWYAAVGEKVESDVCHVIAEPATIAEER